MSWKALIPRVVKMRMPADVKVGTAKPEDAVQWWSQDHYVAFKSMQALRWAGVNWMRWSYEKFPDAYFAPADDIVALIREMTAATIVPALDATSRVFEGGCNLGRNLWAIRQAFGCEVGGMDISPTAITTAREKIWPKLDRVTLILDNVLSSAWFDTIPDRHFDLAFTRWHLIHIPRSPEKAKYLDNLKRISKTFVILEPVSEERAGTIHCQMDGRICHSWDSWGLDYGLTEYRARAAMENTAVFYSRQ
jgi:SAM-dependent methyltransferase